MKGTLGKVYYSTADISKLMGISVQGARAWLKRHGAARKRGGRWVTTRSQLAAAFPEAFQELGR